MAGLEQVVRPYQGSSKRFGKLFVQSIQPVPTEPDAAVLEWSAQTSVQTTEIKGYTFTVKLKDTQREIARKVTTRRITNPEDPNQYVDVATIDEIDFKGPKGKFKYIFEYVGPQT